MGLVLERQITLVSAIVSFIFLTPHAYFTAGLHQRVLRPHLPHLPHSSVGTAADLCHLPISHGDGSCQIPGRKGQEVCGVTPRLSLVRQPWQKERRAVVDLCN